MCLSLYEPRGRRNNNVRTVPVCDKTRKHSHHTFAFCGCAKLSLITTGEGHINDDNSNEWALSVVLVGLYPTGHCTNHTQADLGFEGVVPIGRELPVLACLDNIVTIIQRH